MHQTSNAQTAKLLIFPMPDNYNYHCSMSKTFEQLNAIKNGLKLYN